MQLVQHVRVAHSDINLCSVYGRPYSSEYIDFAKYILVDPVSLKLFEGAKFWVLYSFCGETFWMFTSFFGLFGKN